MVNPLKIKEHIGKEKEHRRKEKEHIGKEKGKEQSVNKETYGLRKKQMVIK